MPLRATALEIVRRLHRANFEAYWVGGCVRDVLLGREPGDYDVATSAKPAEIESLFRHTIPVGKQYGVVLIVEDGEEFEVATFRAEGDYEDGRHPGRVTFSDAKADALRRDFTINGLFYDPLQGRTYDWVGGESDLRAKILRTIGSPEERFSEDHLRLLRAVRLAAQLSFAIDPETFAALQRHSAKITKVSAERIREELLRLFRAPHAARGLDLLRQSGLLLPLLPEIAATTTCEQSPDYHPEGSVFNHLLRMLEHLPIAAPDSLPWAVLLHDVAKPVTASKDKVTGALHFYGHEKVGADMANAILRRLKFPRRQTDEIVQCVRAHMQFKDVPQMRKATVRRMILRPTFPIELELHRLDCLGSHGSLDIFETLIKEAQELDRQPTIKPPLMNGSDLIALGMKPGPAMGELLSQIRELQLQGELTSLPEAQAWATAQLKKRADT